MTGVEALNNAGATVKQMPLVRRDDETQVERRVTSLDPGTDSTVRAAWFPT